MTGPAGFPSNWYQLVLDSVAEVVLVLDASGRLVWANRTAQLMLGYDVEAAVGHSVLDWVHPDDLEEAARILSLSLDRGYSWPIEVRVRHADGSYITMAVSDLDAVSDERDQFVLSLRRVQTPRVASAAAHADLSPLVLVLHHVSDAVVAIGAEGQVVFRNRSAIDLFRLGAARVMQPLPAGVVLGTIDPMADSGLPYREPFQRVRNGEKVPRHEARLTFPDGSERLVEVTGEPVTDSNGRPSGGVVAFRDVTELRRQEAELRELALRDALTGLANRTELMAHLRTMLADRLLRGGHVVVMFVDLDRFKDINDTFDHLVGDEVLQLTARRLLECVDGDGLVARFGGEEFVVVTVQDSAEADGLARRIVDRLREPMSTAAGLLSTSCSVGLSSGSGATEPEQLLREADTAVYTAKRMGGATVAWYDRTQRERAVHRLRAVREARTLSTTSGLLRYRPVFDLCERRVLAFRAEVPDSDRSVISAQSALDRRVIAAYFEHMATVDRQLRDACGPDAPLLVCAVPLAALAQRALVGELEEVLDRTEFPRHRRLIDAVTVDATASIDPHLLAGYAHDLHTRLILDDARVLQASHLLDLDLGVWAVRVPRELVWRLTMGQPGDVHAVKAYVEMAAALGVPVAADRVDTDHQLHVVTGLGVRVGWGDALAPTQRLEDLLLASRDEEVD